MADNFSPNWKDNLIKLIDALESDQYEQGANRLKGGLTNYCILGLACEVYSWEHDARWVTEYDRDGFPNYFFTMNDKNYLENRVISIPPRKVREWFGLTNPDIAYLSNMNDRGKKTFRDFAQQFKERIEKENI